MVRSIVALVLAAMCAAPALAIPGQTTAQFLAWAKTVLPDKALQTGRDDMSALPLYHADFHVGMGPKYEVVFTAEPDGNGLVRHETIALQRAGTMETYDFRKHKSLAHQILAWVYGANMAADFSDAKLVADYPLFQSPTHQAIYRGQLYGYRLSGIAIDVMRLQDVNEAVKSAKDCSTRDCGD